MSVCVGGRLSSARRTAGTVEELFVLITVNGRACPRHPTYGAIWRRSACSLVFRCSRPMVQWSIFDIYTNRRMPGHSRTLDGNGWRHLLAFAVKTGEGTPMQRQRTPDVTVTRAAIAERRILSSRGSFGPTGGAFIGNGVKEITGSLLLQASAAMCQTRSSGYVVGPIGVAAAEWIPSLVPSDERQLR